MMKFRKYREFAEAISEALKKLMDDEWHSGRLGEKNQTSYLSILKKEKTKSAGKIYINQTTFNL